MKKFYFIFFGLLLIFSSVMNGQYCSRQAGLRMGYRGGIFYQLNHEAGNAEIGYNAMLGFSNHGIQFTGLRIVYETSLSTISPDLFLAWGYGCHVGFIYTDHMGYLGESYSEYMKI